MAAAIALMGSPGPLIYEVPPGNRPTLGHRPLFHAMPFRVERGRLIGGSWITSDDLLGRETRRVVIVASWCPACHHLLRKLAAQPRRSRELILFLDDEAERRNGTGAILTDAASLERYPLEFYVVRASGSGLARQVTHYPFRLLCNRRECTRD